MKKKHVASQFPNISRIFPEKKISYYLSVFFVFLSVILLTFLIVFYGIRVYKYYSEVQIINSQRQEISDKINFWKSVANKYEGYKDAYFRIAILEYSLGNFEKAKQYNKKALLLDPNFEDAKKLEELLNKNNY